MKIVIAGSGAMGCFLGSKLYEQGNEVLLVDNWVDHVKTIQEKGLEIIDDNGSHVDLIKSSLPKESKGEFDLLIILTKAMQTADMMKSCQHLINEDTYILTLQNGLGNIDILEKFVPREKLIAGVTTFGSNLLGPGKIKSLGSGIIQMMQIDGIDSQMLNNINKAFTDANIDCTICDDVMKSIWTKVTINCVLNPLCSVMGTTISDISKYEGIQDLCDNLISEIIAVAKAENILLDEEKIKSMLTDLFNPSVCGNHIPSMLQDIQNGRETEIEFLNGTIIKLGQKHNIITPSNNQIYHLVKILEKKAS